MATAPTPELDLSAEAKAAGPITVTDTALPVARSMPDITPAQVGAAITALIGQAVAYGILDPGAAQNAIHRVTLDLPLAWIAGDAIIRLARNIAHGMTHRA